MFAHVPDYYSLHTSSIPSSPPSLHTHTSIPSIPHRYASSLPSPTFPHHFIQPHRNSRQPPLYHPTTPSLHPLLHIETPHPPAHRLLQPNHFTPSNPPLSLQYTLPPKLTHHTMTLPTLHACSSATLLLPLSPHTLPRSTHLPPPTFTHHTPLNSPVLNHSVCTPHTRFSFTALTYTHPPPPRFTYPTLHIFPVMWYLFTNATHSPNRLHSFSLPTHPPYT